MLSRIRRFWSETSPLVRTVVGLSWLSSLALVGFGWLGDSNDYWSDKPFMTNLASSMASALFGIPIAIVFLQRLYSEQNAHGGQVQAIRDARAGAQELVRIAPRLANSDVTRLREVQRLIDAIASDVTSYDEPISGGVRARIVSARQVLGHALPEPDSYRERYEEASQHEIKVSMLRNRRLESDFAWTSEIPRFAYGVSNAASAHANLGGALQSAEASANPMGPIDRQTMVEGTRDYLTRASDEIGNVLQYIEDAHVAADVIAKNTRGY